MLPIFPRQSKHGGIIIKISNYAIPRLPSVGEFLISSTSFWTFMPLEFHTSRTCFRCFFFVRIRTASLSCSTRCSVSCRSINTCNKNIRPNPGPPLYLPLRPRSKSMNTVAYNIVIFFLIYFSFLLLFM